MLLLPGNVAYNKTATQQGTYGKQTADLAVDGLVKYAKSCAHPFAKNCATTPSRPAAWWQVDLGVLHRIYNVTVYGDDEYIRK